MMPLINRLDMQRRVDLPELACCESSEIDWSAKCNESAKVGMFSKAPDIDTKLLVFQNDTNLYMVTDEPSALPDKPKYICGYRFSLLC